MAVEHLPFLRAEGRLHDVVIDAVALVGHGLGDPPFPKPFAILLHLVLPTLVAMEYQALQIQILFEGLVLDGAAGEHLRERTESFLGRPFFVGVAVLQPFDPPIVIQPRPIPDAGSEGALAFDARRLDTCLRSLVSFDALKFEFDRVYHEKYPSSCYSGFGVNFSSGRLFLLPSRPPGEDEKTAKRLAWR